jgi:hypothetical protein
MTGAPRGADEVPLPGGDFRLFVTRLSLQGMLSMGLLENPLTGSKAVNLPNARMVVDDLRMLQEKTFGNLDDEERAFLDKVVADLRRAYAQTGAGTD